MQFQGILRLGKLQAEGGSDTRQARVVATEEDEIAVPDSSFEIVMDGSVFVVSGPGMERLIDSVHFDDLDSLNWFHRMLRKLGIIDALRAKGAGEGSTVRIAEMEFDFVE